MATYRAVSSVCEALIDYLSHAYTPSQFDNQTLTFRVYSTQDFANRPIASGVSLYLYRLQVHGTNRNPTGRLTPDGRRPYPRLPLELHFLLTAWASDASLQNAIAGWMMRQVADIASMPAALLNQAQAGVFQADETVEIVPGELSTEDLVQLWDVVAPGEYQLSVPYVARVVEIDTTLAEQTGAKVRTRTTQMGTEKR